MRQYRIPILVGAFLWLVQVCGTNLPPVWGIASEQPGWADVFGEVDANCRATSGPRGWCGYFTDPNKTFLSYAAVAVGANGGLCSGAFIGPNLLMTASHCGGPEATPQSIMYLGTAVARPGSQTKSLWSLATGNMLLGAIQQDAPPVWYRGAADVQLFYCPDVMVRGQLLPPGLLLGDLDFDLREVSVNEPVYRFWWNSIMDRGNQGNLSHLLISQGMITNTSGTYGFQNTPAYSDNTCANLGASGSPGISATWQRILIGPLDNGGKKDDLNLPCTVGTRGAKAHAIFETFYLDPGLYPVQISPSTISSLGLVPELYLGWQDKDRNNVLDIQQDIELVRGEVARDHYWYNFDSRHRNVLWQQYASTLVFPDQVTPPGPPFGIVHLEATQSETLFRLDTFPLQPNTTYRVNFKLIRVDSAGSSQALQFSGPSVPSKPIPTRVSQNPVRVTFRFTTGEAPRPGIRFEATAPIRADIQVLSIIKEGSVMDFDTVDKRGGWRNQNTSGRALILPDGLTAAFGAPPDFALALTRDSSLPAASDWSAMNEHLALVPGDNYSICFKKKSSGGSLSGRAEAMTGAGVALSSLDFSSSSHAWEDACLPTFTAQSDTRLRFGSRTTGGEHILVDSITVTRVGNGTTTTSSNECELIKQELDDIIQEIKMLQELLKTATPSEKSDIIKEIKNLRKRQLTLKSRARQLGCIGT